MSVHTFTFTSIFCVEFPRVIYGVSKKLFQAGIKGDELRRSDSHSQEL